MEGRDNETSSWCDNFETEKGVVFFVASPGQSRYARK